MIIIVTALLIDCCRTTEKEQLMFPGAAKKCFTQEMTSELGLKKYITFCGKRELSRKRKKKTSTCTREVLRREDERCTVGLSTWNVIYHFGTGGIAEFFKKGMTWLLFKLAHQKDNSDINVEKNEVAGRQLEGIK